MICAKNYADCSLFYSVKTSENPGFSNAFKFCKKFVNHFVRVGEMSQNIFINANRELNAEAVFPICQVKIVLT